MYRVSREGRRASAHEHDSDSRPARYKERFDHDDDKNKGFAPVVGAAGVLPKRSPGAVLCLKATAAFVVLLFVRGMHRSMCPADVLTPEAAELHRIIMNLDQQLEAERESRKAAEDAMEDLRAQDRGHAGMPQAPGSADGRQGRAEAEAKRAGLHEGQGNFHDSENLDGTGGGDSADVGLPKGDVKNLLKEKTEALADTVEELEELEAKNKELLDKVTVLEQQLESRRHLAIHAGDGGDFKKPSTPAPDKPSKKHFGRAPGFLDSRADAEHNSDKHDAGGRGGGAHEFFVNPNDRYEGHPSNQLGEPFEPMDGWVMDEVGKKEEDGLKWGANGDVGAGGSDGGDSMADFNVDPVPTSDGDNHEEKHHGGQGSSSEPDVDAELVAAGGLADPPAPPPARDSVDDDADSGSPGTAETGFGDVAFDRIESALAGGQELDWQVEEGVDWAKVDAENGSGKRPAASWEEQQQGDGSEEEEEGGEGGEEDKEWPAAREDRKTGKDNRFWQPSKILSREEKSPRKAFLRGNVNKIDATGADRGQGQDGQGTGDAAAAAGSDRLPSTHAPAETAPGAEQQQQQQQPQPSEDGRDPRGDAQEEGEGGSDSQDPSDSLPGEQGGKEASPAGGGADGSSAEEQAGVGGVGGSKPESFPKPPGKEELTEAERISREGNLQRLAVDNAAGMLSQVEEMAMAKTKAVLEEAGVPVVERQRRQEPAPPREPPATPAEEGAENENVDQGPSQEEEEAGAPEEADGDGNTAALEEEEEEERARLEEQARLAQEEADKKEAQRLAREAAERAEDEKQERLRLEAERREAEKAARLQAEQKEAAEKARKEAEKEEKEKALREANENAAKAAAEAGVAADAAEAKKVAADADAAKAEEERAHKREHKRKDEEKRAKKAAEQTKAEKEAALSRLVMGGKPKDGKGRGGGDEEEDEEDDDLAPRGDSRKKKLSSKPAKLRQEPKKKSSHGTTKHHKKDPPPIDDDDMKNSFKVPGEESQDDEFTTDDGEFEEKGRKAAAPAIPADEMKRRDEEARKFLGRQA